MLKLIATNNITRGIYMLYFGMLTLGMISISAGYPGIGGKVGFVIGVAIILFTTDLSSTIYNLRTPLLWIAWIALILLLFYFYGPMTQYCTDKLITTAINGVLFLIIFYNMFNNRSVDWFDLGQLGILSSYVFLSVGLIIAPELKPNSILDIGAIRITFFMLLGSIDVIEIQNNISFLASMGIMLMYAASPDGPLSRLNLMKTIVYIFFSAIMLSWSAARLPIVATIIACTLIPFMKPVFKGRYLTISVLLFCFFILFIVVGLVLELNFIQNVLDSSNSFASRVNRDTNWISAYERFIEKPLFGYGLGGYFIEGYSAPGSGTYAHNLFLELLSEMGIIGTILVTCPIFFWRRLLNKDRFLLRAQNGGLIFVIFIMVFLQSMISFDLKSSIALFSVIGTMATVLNTENYPNSNG
jgi:O-antigen ligase